MSNEDEEKAEQKRLDAKARRAAKRAGLIVRKSRCAISSYNRGRLMLLSAETGNTVAGAEFELSHGDVIAICEA